MILLAYLTVADFNLRHNRIKITATTEPDTTDFAEWVVWASAIVNNYLHVTADITDSDGIIENIVDDLCVQKYTYEKLTAHIGSIDILNIPQPALTAEHKVYLDNIEGVDAPPAYYYDMDYGSGIQL